MRGFCAVHSSVNLVHIEQWLWMNFTPDTSERRKRCEIYAVFGLLMKQFCVQHLWSVLGALFMVPDRCASGGISGLWMQSNLKKSRKAGFGNISTPISACPDFIYGLCLCTLRYSMPSTGRKNNCRPMPFSGTMGRKTMIRGDLSYSLWLLGLAAIWKTAKNVSISCRLWLRNP